MAKGLTVTDKVVVHKRLRAVDANGRASQDTLNKYSPQLFTLISCLPSLLATFLRLST
jgi:hypothetical protein